MDQVLLSRLLAVEPLPRGERLARWEESSARGVDTRTWALMWCRSRIPAHASAIRAHARPLRLAREKARRLRAELFKAWAWEQELSAMHRQEKDRADRAAADLHHTWTATSEWYRHQWCDAEDRAQRAEAKLARLREKVWRRALVHSLRRVESDSTVVARVHMVRSWMERCHRWRAKDRRNWRHALGEAMAARIAMHAAGRGVPGSQPGWEG